MATALTEQLSEGPFDPSRLWHGVAPSKLVKKWDAGDGRQRWDIWRKHLSRRKTPAEVPFLAGKRPEMFWGWPDGWGRSHLAVSARALARGSADFIGNRHHRGDVAAALEAVATAYALPGLAAKLSADAWWKLAESLRDLARDAEQLQVDWERDPAQLVRMQLLAGELPLALAYLFPELRPMRSLRKPARQALDEALSSATDGNGTPHARLLGVLAPLLASWTRSQWLGDRVTGGAWSRSAEKQFRLVLRRAIRLTNSGPRFAWDGADQNNGPRASELQKILSMALELTGDKPACAAAVATISKSLVPRHFRIKKPKPPAAAFNSTWSGLAVMATGWSKSSARLAVSYTEHPHRLELHVGERQLLGGILASETLCDGQPVRVVTAWDKQCWQSDKDCDYLELGVDLAEGLRLERQLLLAKEDHVLLIADVLLHKDRTPCVLRHSLSLPLADRVAWCPEEETRDGALVAKKQRAAVLPLALAEWRTDFRGGTLLTETGRLTLTQQTTARALYCPLLIDLKPRRSRKERTWRQLTVAESLAALSHDVAVGYRAQSGRDQWLFYRSLAPPGNRTVLGHNLSTEFFAGRFLTTGEVDEWIEIEPE